MKLQHNCPKCGRAAKIQAQFPVGNMVNYVYQCGHVELLKKEIGIENDSRINFDAGNNAKSVENNSTLNSSTNSTNVSTLIEEVKVPEPTHKELYDDLDRWVTEGGYTKDPFYEEKIPEYIHPSFYSVDGSKCAYKFQREGIVFAEKSQLRCLIADEQGLGKTIQAYVALKRSKDIVFPALILVRGSILFQHHHEFTTWVSNELKDCIPVIKRSHIIPGFNCYIMSRDLFHKKDVMEKLFQCGIKTVVIDECQDYKDDTSKRTQGLMKLIKMGQIKHIIALSGTPIKNRADEYFPILNILAPQFFRDKADFKRDWLTYNEKGQYTRINPYKAEQFQELIGNWVIRRNKIDVMPDLPDLTRDYQIIEIDDTNIKNSYNHTLDLFKNWLNSNVDGISSTALLGWLSQLRCITGQAKCKNALEWTKDFLESTEDSLSIGIQHTSVRDVLHTICTQFGYNPLKLSGEDNIYKKNEIVRNFTSGNNRLLIINMIAGGTGLNLQTCANALVLERMWNSADEEQFESRFHRNGQKKAVTITYMIAKGTIDEFFHDMVMKKRKILHEVGIGKGIDMDNDIQSLKDFANLVVSHKI